MTATTTLQKSAIGGVPKGHDARIVAGLVRKRQKTAIYVLEDDRQLELAAEALGFFDPDLPILRMPAWDCLPYDRVSPNPVVSALRTSTLCKLATGLESPSVVLATVASVSQYAAPREVMKGAAFLAETGKRIDEAALRGFMSRMGFAKAPSVSEPGDFAVRGGIIDIFPPGADYPVRLDLFGDVLESARKFDPATQKSIGELERVQLFPASEIILDEEAALRFRKRYREEFGAAGLDDPLYEAVSSGQKYQGVEHWLPFFHDRLETVFDYVPGSLCFFADSVDSVHQGRWEIIEAQHQARADALRARSSMESVYKPCPARALYLDRAALEEATSGHETIQLSILPRPEEGAKDGGGRLGKTFEKERQANNAGLFGILAGHVRKAADGRNVVIASATEGARERLGELLEENGIGSARRISRFSDLELPKGEIALAVWPLSQGFQTRDLVVVSEQDVLGERLVQSARRRRRAENFLSEVASLSPGDLVVHVEHGIGRFTGLETILAAGVPHDCILLEYADSGRLYLPVENIELLSKYGHEGGILDRLGSGAWQARKARLKKRVLDMAGRLIRVAAERALRTAPVLEPPPESWERFVSQFPYVETEDQLRAVDDTMSDLARGIPMDRLICGDVGFGKTEVAMRAAFVTLMAGAQVAVIAPTTLLARQHHASFSQRLRNFGVKPRQLSRLVPPPEAAETRRAIADGSARITIGTHALLADSIRFQNLGLLILDEEQRFGVAHKEKLKELRSEIHVLALSATPIPRTLQMSLSGIRELSVIETPPIDRLSIRTYVSEFDVVTVRDALLREHYRGGQSFLVVPRISCLPDMEHFLSEHVPEISFVTAHGQMPPGELDRRMNAFYDNEHGVLLATTIIENGLDIPSANTMIIYMADSFGLAQLHQIRGRVGRSKVRAYAYLTTKPGKPLTESAVKRLRVLGSLDSLGAGFSVASHDLDMRGAGNLLGDAQSGHIHEVGYELYQSMLEEALAELKSGKGGQLPHSGGDWSPQINLGVPVLIPEPYVPDLDVRLGLYRRLSALSSKVEIEAFASELIDRFGKLPREVSILLKIVRVKSLCKKAGISRLDGGPKGCVIQFHKNTFRNPAGLADFLEESQGGAKISSNNLVVQRSWSQASERIKGAHEIALSLARKALAKEAG